MGVVCEWEFMRGWCKCGRECSVERGSGLSTGSERGVGVDVGVERVFGCECGCAGVGMGVA